MIERGGIHRDVCGTTPREVLSTLVETFLPVSSVSQDKLIEAVLEREALMTTCIGDGVAVPHPRNFLVTDDSEQFAALAFLKNPVDWNSLDGKQVDTLLLIVSASAKQHLQMLAEMTFFCRQENFRRLLNKRASREDLLRFIREAEKNWE